MENSEKWEKKKSRRLTTYRPAWTIMRKGRIFLATEVVALKSRERQTAEKNDMTYYRCKDKHRKLYHNLTQAFAPFITHKMMSMLHHQYDTHTKRNIKQ